MQYFNIIKQKLCTFVLIGILPMNIALANDLIFTAPPRESPAAGNKLYQPIVTYLSKQLNRKVKYQHPGNWLNYQNKMRKDAYDIIFDGPHFVSWRIVHLGHEALVKLPGTLEFMVITAADNAALTKPKDMIGKYFCGISPPNLSSLSFLGTFRNPVLQPKVKGIKGGMKNVFKAFQQGKCSAAVLRKIFYNKELAQAQRNKLKVIFNSGAFPNQAISVSKRVNFAEKQKIIHAFTGGEGVNSTRSLVKRFAGGKVTSFVKTNNAEYKNNHLFLEGVIFGW